MLGPQAQRCAGFSTGHQGGLISAGAIEAIKGIGSIEEAGEATRALGIEAKTFEGVAKSGGVAQKLGKTGLVLGGTAGLAAALDKATDSTTEKVQNHLLQSDQ